MKCLWIEDFNHKQPNSEEEQQWRERYDLPNRDVILKTTLTEGLAYIEEVYTEVDKYDQFDSVILDIDLEIGEPIKDKSYKDFLEGFMSDEYLEKHEDEIEKIAGFYVFLKLILDKGFPKNRIAFLTANYQVDTKNDAIDNLLRFLKRYDEKAQFRDVFKGLEKYEQEKINRYINILIDVESKLVDNMKEKLNKDIHSILVYLKSLRNAENKQGNDAYNRYEDIFESAGIKPPKPYLKDNEDYIERFKEWKDSQNTEYYILRRGIIEICRELKRKLKKQGKSFILFNKFIHNRASEDKKRMYNIEYFIEMLTYIQSILPIKEPKDKGRLYRQIIRIISHDWETAFAIYPYEFNVESYEKSFSCVMKLLRNWTAHSKVEEDFSTADVALLFIISMRTFFDLNIKFSEDQDSEESRINYYEKTLLQLQENKIGSGLEEWLQENAVKSSNLKEILKISFNEITSREYNSYSKGEKWKWKESASFNVYRKFEEIGSQDSNEKSSVRDFYKLLWHSIFYSKWDDYKENSSDFTSLKVDFSIDEAISIIKNKDNIIYELFISNFKGTFQEEMKSIQK